MCTECKNRPKKKWVLKILKKNAQKSTQRCASKTCKDCGDDGYCRDSRDCEEYGDCKDDRLWRL